MHSEVRVDTENKSEQDMNVIEDRQETTRISHPRNLLNVLPNVEIRPMNGRVIGTKSPSIPPMVRKIIGETAHIAGMGGGCTETAEAFGVHRNTVTKLKKETEGFRVERDKEIHEQALDRIVGMFTNVVSDEKLATLDIKDATRSMKDLAKVAETFGEKQKSIFKGPTIIIFNPNQHSEDDYDVIDVEAKELQ